MHAMPKGGYAHSHEYMDKQFGLIIDDYKQDMNNEDDLYYQMTTSTNDKHGVILGMGPTIKTILMTNIIICLMFLLQGLRMIQVAKPTLVVTDILRKGKIEEGPAHLNKLGVTPTPPKILHNKIKWFYLLTMMTTIMLLFSFGLRLLCTYKNMEKEFELVTTYEKVNDIEDEVKNAKTKDKGKVSGDALIWSYIHMIKERHVGSLSDGIKNFANTDFAGTQS